MLRETSLRQLEKNPLRWLRQNVSDSHAQTIPPKFYAMEAWRIVHVMACRWLGETVFLDPLKNVDWSDVVWSRPSDYESEDPAPIHDIEAAAKARRSKAAEAKRARNRAADPVRYGHIVDIIKPFVVEANAKGLPLTRPKVIILADVWAAVWMSGPTSLVVTGALNGPPDTISITEEEDGEVSDMEYDHDTLAIFWSVFHATATT